MQINFKNLLYESIHVEILQGEEQSTSESDGVALTSKSANTETSSPSSGEKFLKPLQQVKFDDSCLADFVGGECKIRLRVDGEHWTQDSDQGLEITLNIDDQASEGVSLVTDGNAVDFPYKNNVPGCSTGNVLTFEAQRQGHVIHVCVYTKFSFKNATGHWNRKGHHGGGQCMSLIWVDESGERCGPVLCKPYSHESQSNHAMTALSSLEVKDGVAELGFTVDTDTGQTKEGNRPKPLTISPEGVEELPLHSIVQQNACDIAIEDTATGKYCDFYVSFYNAGGSRFGKTKVCVLELFQSV